ncbi:MAG TPA: sodium-dependent transporter [Gammaproteobacteria bacterium]|nr:sodium-dependent transporter [Gammaproteobacteria bacterium]
MQQGNAGAHEGWSSRIVFLMAAVGAAVGLGNLWKFPYTAGVSGGAAFVLVYLLAVGAVAVPIVIAELLIGRRGRMSPPNSFIALAREAGASPGWRFVGWMNLLAVFLILSFYSVIAGWALAYVPKLALGHFSGASAEQVAAEFGTLLGSPGLLAALHALFMALTVGIVAVGLKRGIERAVRFLMPALLLMLVSLVLYAAVAGDLPRTIAFLFQADFSKITAPVVLQAIGQAFFSVSVAMGLLITYGAYLDRETNIGQSAVFIAGADTAVALLSGLAIFPLVFANGLDPAEGPGLIFVTLPIAFGQMPAGALFGALFFMLVLVSALTSSIAILEPIVSWAEEHDWMRRGPATIIAGIAAWVVGLATVFSFNLWAGWFPLGRFERFRESTAFDLIDYLTSNLLLPLGGMLIAVFVGWVLTAETTREELGMPDSPLFRAWRFLLRYLAPLAVGWVLVANVL